MRQWRSPIIAVITALFLNVVVEAVAEGDVLSPILGMWRRVEAVNADRAVHTAQAAMRAFNYFHICLDWLQPIGLMSLLGLAVVAR